MKKRNIIIIASLCALFAVSSSRAGGTYEMRGVEYTVDTLFHNYIGPGTTQTSLLFQAGTTHLRVFYTTIDLTNPYVSLATVNATDKVAGNERVSTMAQRKSKAGARYFAGINGDFFLTSGSTPRGVSVVGTPVGSTVVDGEVFTTNNASSVKCFAVDKQGGLYTNPITFGGTVASGGSSVALGGINTITSPNNAITVYTSKFYGSTNQTSSGCEVQAVLAAGSTVASASPYQLVVTGTPSTEGDMLIPSDGFVIRGRGTAQSFVENLQEGDVVTISPTWTCAGVNIDPQQMVSGNPKILGDGEILDSEGDRGDASANHPRTGIGFGDNGNKVYFLVVDGRSLISSGARTSIVAALMKYAGCTDAINLDGGGSSALYTSALGIRNVPSDGNERADANAFFAVSSAPDDNEIAEIRFVDFSLVVPKYGVYTPKFYGYNQYGMLVDTDVEGVTLSCDASFGEIRDDGATFYASGNGTQNITATLGDISITEKLTIKGSADNVSVATDSVINDGYTPYTVAVVSNVNDNLMPLDAAALTWTSSDPSVVQIEENTGTLIGLKNGEAYVTGTVADVSCTQKVIVEIPTARAMPIDPGLDPATWTVAQSGGKNTVAENLGDGMKISYTGASARLTYIRLTKDFRLWSLPDTLRLRVNPGDAPVTGAKFALRTRGGNISYPAVTADMVPNQINYLDLPIDTWIDANDMSLYPITLTYIQLDMGKSTAGTEYVIEIPGIETVYAEVPLAPPHVYGDVNGDGQVTAADVSAVYNIILGASTDHQATADVNGDGEVTVGDVLAVYNVILGS